MQVTRPIPIYGWAEQACFFRACVWSNLLTFERICAIIKKKPNVAIGFPERNDAYGNMGRL